MGLGVPNTSATNSVAIVGAGISGASLAHALAQRGWPVTVLDAGNFGASTLPLGLISPHSSKDDGALSQLSRLGMARMHQAMRDFIEEGVDWMPSGVKTYPRTGPVSDADTLWQPTAAWVKPSALIQAMLRHPRIDVVRGSPIETLRFDHDTMRWQAWASGECIAQTAHVVLAAGPGSLDLLEQATWFPLKAIRGQISWGLMSETPHAAMPSTPVNGRGSFVPRVPTSDGNAWYVGATFDREHPRLGVTSHDHTLNLHRLTELLPRTAQDLALVFASSVRGWAGVRCTVHDRLPLVGAVPHAAKGLWMNTAMGSRGLTLGVLCSDILAGLMAQEPSPVHQPLLDAIAPHRFIRY